MSMQHFAVLMWMKRVLYFGPLRLRMGPAGAFWYIVCEEGMPRSKTYPTCVCNCSNLHYHAMF